MSDQVRASDGERERAALALRDAAGEGRLTLEELTSRLDLAYRATTRAELSRLTADLPAVAGRREVGRAVAGRRRWVVAVMSGALRKGRWQPGARVSALAFMGGCKLDLRQAELTEPVLRIAALAVMGAIDITVPEGVEVHVGGVSLMGGKHVRLADVPVAPGGPVIEVRAVSLMGGVTVRSKPRPAARELPAA
ncbi:MAG TPA: DUF1707 domain-containing protein [Solirubrobacteraceae bacterium]|nr:DUF1707 domain-containing protein [Solirubrobacteraceae bacterium]